MGRHLSLWNGASEARVEQRRARRKGNQVPAQIETDVNTVCVTETLTLEWVSTATSDSVTEAENPTGAHIHGLSRLTDV